MKIKNILLGAFAALAISGAAFADQTINDNVIINGNLTATGNFVGGGNVSTLSCRNMNVGGVAAVLAADGNNSTPVITEAYIGEIFVPYGCVATGIAVFNGSDVTGNMTLAIYNASGTLVANTLAAGTAGSGTDAYQLVPFTAAVKLTGPATYYIVSTYSSATARYNTFAVGKFGCSKATGLTFGTLPATITPPTTFTTALCNIAGLY